MSNKSVNVAIIGTGVVGSSFLDQIVAMKSNITYNIIYVAELSKALISEDYSPLALGSDWAKAVNGANQGPLALEKLVDFLKSLQFLSFWLITHPVLPLQASIQPL